MKKGIYDSPVGVTYSHEDRIRPGVVVLCVGTLLVIAVLLVFLRAKKPEATPVVVASPQVEVKHESSVGSPLPQVAESVTDTNDGTINLRVGVTRGQFPASDPRWDKQTNR